MPGLLIDKQNIGKYKLDKLSNIMSNIPKSSNGIILLLDTQHLSTLNKLPFGESRIKHINSHDFINKINNIVHVSYDKDKKICELGSVISNKSYLKDVMKSLSLYLPQDTSIWSGIVPSKHMSVYISAGFDDPYICDKSPIRKNNTTSGIALWKTNGELSDITSARNKLKYVVSHSFSPKKCQIFSKFSPKTIKYFQKINTPTKKEKELSGSLKVGRVIRKDTKIIFELSPDPKSVISGAEEEVDAVWSRYNFHTHPKTAYDNHGVVKGWPSAQDYVGFIELNNHTIFHTVVTLEGIYVISFHSEWKGKVNQIDKKYIMKHYNISHESKLSFENYTKKINKKKYKGTQLFIVRYMKWEDATDIFPVFYEKTGKNCVTTDRNFLELSKGGKPT